MCTAACCYQIGHFDHLKYNWFRKVKRYNGPWPCERLFKNPISIMVKNREKNCNLNRTLIVAYGFDHKFAKQVKYSPFLIKAN